MSDSKSSCQSQACDLQACLNKHTYTPEKCDAYVRKLYECCHQMYATDPNAESSACPMPRVVDRWLKNHDNSNSSSNTQ